METHIASVRRDGSLVSATFGFSMLVFGSGDIGVGGLGFRNLF